MYERAIEILESANRIFRENVAEWEREADPHRLNEVRMESLRRKIELAMECLKKGES